MKKLITALLALTLFSCEKDKNEQVDHQNYIYITATANKVSEWDLRFIELDYVDSAFVVDTIIPINGSQISYRHNQQENTIVTVFVELKSQNNSIVDFHYSSLQDAEIRHSDFQKIIISTKK